MNRPLSLVFGTALIVLTVSCNKKPETVQNAQRNAVENFPSLASKIRAEFGKPDSKIFTVGKAYYPKLVELMEKDPELKRRVAEGYIDVEQMAGVSTSGDASAAHSARKARRAFGAPVCIIPPVVVVVPGGGACGGGFGAACAFAVAQASAWGYGYAYSKVCTTCASGEAICAEAEAEAYAYAFAYAYAWACAVAWAGPGGGRAAVEAGDPGAVCEAGGAPLDATVEEVLETTLTPTPTPGA